MVIKYDNDPGLLTPPQCSGKYAEREGQRQRYSEALFLRPKIPEIPAGEANGTDIFLNFIAKCWVWPKIPENRNNRRIPFHSAIPSRA